MAWITSFAPAPRRRDWLLAVALVLAAALGARAQTPGLDRLQGLTEELSQAPVPCPEATAARIREEANEVFSELALGDGAVGGVPERVLAARHMQALASLFMHRYERVGDAKALVQNVVSLLERMGDARAAVSARSLLRKLEVLESRSAEAAHAVDSDLEVSYTPPPMLWPFLGGLTALGALVALYLLVFRARDTGGLEVADAVVQAEAQRALDMGIRLLRRDMVPQALKYFQKVAELESTLRDRGRYFMALVALHGGDDRTMTTTLSQVDFAAIEPDEAYTLGDMLERRGQVDQAMQVFEKLYLSDINFRDVKTRLDRLREEAEQLTGGEIGAMIAQRILDKRFQGVELLGAGGMGFVYRAHDGGRDGQLVAVKVLSPFYANNKEAYTRFLREAKGIAQLGHPNLVQIFDVFQANLPYYSMEFLTDRTLKDLFTERGRIPAPELVGLLAGTAEGLAVAHERGIVHRDMKPSNVLLLPDGTPKVIDFGIAHFDEMTAVTVTGRVMGTPMYMAPEQLKGAELDQRADIYALGVMLYQALSGTLPFESPMERVLKPPPPLPTDAGIPGGVEAVVQKALAKDPEGRYGDVRELARDFAAAAGS